MAIATYTFPPVSVAFPPGLATAANQVTQIGLETSMEASLLSIDSKLTSPVAVTGPLTDVELRASPVPVSVAGVSTAANQATEIASLSSIDTKLSSQATAANQATEIASLSSIDTKLSAQATAANQATEIASLSSIDTKLSSQATAANQSTQISTLNSIDSKVTRLTVVDQIDSTPLLDVSSTNIPASASAPVQVVSSLAAQVYKVISVEDIGEFIGLYTGTASSEVLACILPLGGGEVEVSIPAGTRISLRNMKNAAIVSDFIAINFLG